VPVVNMQLAKSSSLPNLQSRRDGAHFQAASKAMLSSPVQSYNRGADALVSAMSPDSLKTRRQGAASAAGSPVGNNGLTGRMVVQGFWGTGPPRAGAYTTKFPKGTFDKQHVFEANVAPASAFRRFFERGDLPICVRHGAHPGIEWKVEPERLDYVYHLPIFFDGLLEKQGPYNFLAYSGLQDMLNAARGKEPSLIAPAVPTLIVPLKRALNTRDNDIMCRCLNMIQLLVRVDNRVGELLVPYYRQLLPVFNLYRSNNKNLGDRIEYSQRKRENMGDLIQETLELLEKNGGEDAFINIKYMIPTYESCVTS